MKVNPCLEIKEDGQIWIWFDRPVEPSKPSSWAHQEFFTEYYEDIAKYHESLASAERLLVSNQEVAKELITQFLNKLLTDGQPIESGPLLKPGFYPIPNEELTLKKEAITGISE